MAVEKAGLNSVKPEERKSWITVALIWAGNVVCVPAFMNGGFITSGMGFGSAALAMLLGFIICAAIMVFMGMQSSDTGLPTAAAVAGAFGKTGARYVISTVIVVCSICWFGFQSAICGEAFSGLLAMIGVNIPVNFSIFFWGAIMCVTAVYGITLIKILNQVSVPALILLMIYSMFIVFNDPEGAAKIANHHPVVSTPFLKAVGMAAGGFVVGTVLTGDVTRYCKCRKDAVTSALVGVIPLGAGALLIGGILAIYSGAIGMDNTNFVKMLASTGSPVIGLVVLILATWTTNVGNVYSSGFALLSLSGAKDSMRPVATLIAGAIGTILAMAGILGFFNNWLNLLATFIPPVAGCVMVDYWILRKGKPEDFSFVTGINWIGIAALIAGGGITFLIPSFFIAPINAIIISGIVYFGLSKIAALRGKEALPRQTGK